MIQWFLTTSIITKSLDMSAVRCAVCRDFIVTWRTHGSHRLCSKVAVYDAWVKVGICGWCFKSGEKSPMAVQSHATFRRENLTCTQASIDVWSAGLWCAQVAHYLLCTCVGMFGVMGCGVPYELYHFLSCLTFQHNNGRNQAPSAYWSYLYSYSFGGYGMRRGSPETNACACPPWVLHLVVVI